jgi:hypothetical protein
MHAHAPCQRGRYFVQGSSINGVRDWQQRASDIITHWHYYSLAQHGVLVHVAQTSQQALTRAHLP